MTSNTTNATVAIVDYGMGNLFSVARACEYVGLEPILASNAAELCRADALILPGVGAFGDAMSALETNDFVFPICDAVAAGKPTLGICLGMQLLLSESSEFGTTRGLGLFPGQVIRFQSLVDDQVKVPHVGWNRVSRPEGVVWDDTPMADTPDQSFFYFVHSYYAVPDDAAHIASTTEYDGITFCSSVRNGNLFGCQFHPEKSADQGLAVYRTFAESIRNVHLEKTHV